jgi:hypothetical protein
MLKTVIASMALTLAVLPARAEQIQLVCYLESDRGPDASFRYSGSTAMFHPKYQETKPIMLDCEAGYCATAVGTTTDGSYITLVVWNEGTTYGVDMITRRPDKPILVVAFAANCSEIS